MDCREFKESREFKVRLVQLVQPESRESKGYKENAE